MIKEKRIKKIQEYVLENESVSLNELVTIFNVSKNTIRRDLQELIDTGDFKKIYGGITTINENRFLDSFHDRSVRNRLEKEKIGKLAADFVMDGDIIFIDSGTTTIEMFPFIKEKKITIITNNIEFIIKCIPYENISIISTGGILERKANSFGNYQDIDLLDSYNINKAFMSSTGVSLKNGVTNASPLESRLKQKVINKSHEVYLLVDHEKFNKQGLITYCQLNEVYYLITDRKPEKEYEDFFKKHQVKVINE